jgi:hypothetical protein
VSLYQLHRCVYDFVRAGESSDGAVKVFNVDDYDLNTNERNAFDVTDVAAIYALGLHPVLLNRYCRAVGFARDDYRRMLEPFASAEEGKGRWQK